MIRELCEDGPGLLGLLMPLEAQRRALGIRRRPRRACAIVRTSRTSARTKLQTPSLALIDAGGRELAVVALTAGHSWALALLEREARLRLLRSPVVLA